MSGFRRIHFATVLIALALVAGACGGDDSGGDDSGGDAATTTTAAAGSDGGNVAADTTTTTEAEPVSGDSDSSWCRELRNASEETGGPGDLNFLTATSEELRKAFEVALAAFRDAADSAPAEIDDDAQVILAAYETFVEKGNEVGWVLSLMADDPEFAGAFDDPTVAQAADRIDAYIRDVCGLDFSTLGDGGPTAPPIDADDPVGIVLGALNLPPSLFSEDQIACITDELGEEFVDSVAPGWTPTPEALDALFTAVEACGINLG